MGYSLSLLEQFFFVRVLHENWRQYAYKEILLNLMGLCSHHKNWPTWKLFVARRSPGLIVLCNWGFRPDPMSLGLHSVSYTEGICFIATPTEAKFLVLFLSTLPHPPIPVLHPPNSLQALKVLRKRRAGVKNLKLPKMDSENAMHK